MKKFITSIPFQPTNKFEKVRYAAQENDKFLANNIETRYPIIVAIKNSVQKGENISVTIIAANDHQNVEQNKKLLIEELDLMKADIGFEYVLNEIKTITEETPEKHLELFEQIIGIFEEDDEVYADITYGTKPTPIVMMMALSYAYEMCSNTDVKAVIYGAKNHITGKTEIFDESCLFYMNSVIHKMAQTKPSNPLKFIRNILDM